MREISKKSLLYFLLTVFVLGVWFVFEQYVYAHGASVGWIALAVGRF